LNEGEINGVKQKKKIFKEKGKANTKIRVEGQNRVCINVEKNN